MTNDELCKNICRDCADKEPTARMPKGHTCGWWTGECGACGVEKSVTSVRDYRYPEIKKGKYNGQLPEEGSE